ncbi:zeta toxin family protein [Chitinophaga eiseniae]|uniref:AAA family ATPase n=1 Tax=Chitinophaga eiseniae TaxID=634771 RepID=A0A847SRW2_9BACT|nr:zeta toxin family protein [Chitinophaga eiseniae]NLR81757.1 AAA family ATPase [Chitinophaga eiseniae]
MDFREDENTLISTKHRDRNYKDDIPRWSLRKEIINELFTLPRLENDDDTILGSGGSLPISGIKNEKKAFILIGPPASGKSTIANNISEHHGAIILDSDYAKRKLPEFDYDCGATLVQEESNRILFGFSDNNPQNIKSVYELALDNGYNLVIPKVGQDPGSIIKMADFLAKTGYEIHLTLISLRRRDATIRALRRFNNTKRYVPLGYVFDQVGNDPLLTYYIIKEKGKQFFSTFGAVSTEVNLSDHPKCIDLQGDNPAALYEKSNDRFY